MDPTKSLLCQTLEWQRLAAVTTVPEVKLVCLDYAARTGRALLDRRIAYHAAWGEHLDFLKGVNA